MTTTDTRTVYAGSLWHRDCDRFVTVVALDEQTAMDKLAELARDEISRLSMQGKSDICSAGVFDRSIPCWLSDAARDELETDGITVI